MGCGAVVQTAGEDGRLGIAFLLGLTQTTVFHPTALREGLPGPRKHTSIIAWFLFPQDLFLPGIILQISSFFLL